MRTCSLFIGLVVLGCVSAVVMSRAHRMSPAPTVRVTTPPRWVKVEGKWVERNQRQVLTEVKTEPAPEVQVAPKAVEAAPARVLPPADVVDRKDGEVGVAWTVTGSFQTTPEEAQQAALTLAQAELLTYFRNQGTPLEWTPTPSYILSRLVVDKDKATAQEKDFGDSIGRMYRSVVVVKMTPEKQAEIYRADREFRAQGRMAWLARLTAALVALLAAVAGYFRIDDATKGYYTTWLRVGAGFIGAAALIVMLS